jgi:hypothetical protein
MLTFVYYSYLMYVLANPASCGVVSIVTLTEEFAKKKQEKQDGE